LIENVLDAEKIFKLPILPIEKKSFIVKVVTKKSFINITKKICLKMKRPYSKLYSEL